MGALDGFDDFHAALVFAAGLPTTVPVGEAAVHLALGDALLDRKLAALAADGSQTAPSSPLGRPVAGGSRR